MLGFLYPARQTVAEPEPTSEHILPEDAHWLQFNRLVSRAAELREDVLDRLVKLGPEGKDSVLCKVQELAVEMHGRCAVPVEVLPFGASEDLAYEQATILLSEVKRKAVERHPLAAALLLIGRIIVGRFDVRSALCWFRAQLLVPNRSR